MGKKQKDPNKKGFVIRMLDRVERIGNKLPHPVTLFFLFCLVVMVISAVAEFFGLSVTADLYNRSSGVIETQTIYAVSLLSSEGIVYMLESMVGNFTSFAPLGVVLVAMLGVGMAESSGYISSLIKKAVSITPMWLVTPMVVFLGVLSNVASDAGYVVLVPLGALIFMAYKRHPLAGIAAAFAGVSGGYSANLLVGTLDPMLGGITTEAAGILNPSVVVGPTANYYFMFVSTFIVTFVGTFVTNKIIEPRLGQYEGVVNSEDDNIKNISPLEKKALKYANFTLLGIILLIAAVALPQDSFLRNATTGSLIENSPFMNGLVPILALLFFIPGVVYGRIAKTVKTEKDVCNELGKTMSTMGGYIVLAFIASQFIAYFNYTNLGTIIAVKGADFIEATGLSGAPLIIIFVIVVAFINLFMGSASAKWAILAPIFVPMFMRLGYDPALTQVAYRIGDSTTNIISPLMSYFAVIVVFMNKYDKKSGMGTLISMMLPYSLAFLLGWSALLIIWMQFNLPLGP